MAYNPRARGPAQSPADVAQTLQTIRSRVESTDQADATWFVELGDEIHAALEGVDGRTARTSDALRQAAADLADAVEGVRTEGDGAVMSREEVFRSLRILARAIGGSGSVVDVIRNMDKKLEALDKRYGGRGGAAMPPGDDIEAFQERVEQIHQVDPSGKTNAEVAREMVRLAECARQGRTLGTRLGMLEDAIDTGDFRSVSNMTVQVAFHMGRLGECGESFTSQGVADVAEELLVSMERGDEMGAMSALDRLRTMDE